MAAHQHGPGCSHAHGDTEVLRPPQLQDMVVTGEIDIFRAVELGRLERVRSLLEAPGGMALMSQTCTSECGTPLHFACLYGQVDIVAYLFSLGIPLDLQAKSQMATYPIHWAASRKNVTMLSYLANMGVDLNAVDAALSTPLIKCAQTKQLENAAFLLGKGVDIQAADASGDTALHWSANKGDPELSRMLLAAGANPHALDAYKQSPLHLAVIGGNAGLVRTLVELGVTTTSKDSNKNTALDLALRRGASHRDIALYLRHVTNPTAWSYRGLIWNRRGHERLSFILFIFSGLFLNLGLWIQRRPEDSLNLHAPFLLSQLCVWILFHRLRHSSPGVVGRSESATEAYFNYLKQYSESKDWDKVRQAYPLQRLCHTCRIVKAERTSHCSHCNRCIIQRDHHCASVQNCVGVRNRRLLFLFLTMLSFTLYQAVHVAKRASLHQIGFVYFLSQTFVLLTFTALIASLTKLFATAYLINYGRTFNEHVKGVKYDYLRDSLGEFVNPYNQGTLRNIAWFFRLNSRAASSTPRGLLPS